MPTFTTEITATVDVEFEVFCSCGNGMCGATETRVSRLRGYPQAVVEPCEKCLQAASEEAADKVRDEMQEQIDELQARIDDMVDDVRFERERLET